MILLNISAFVISLLSAFITAGFVALVHFPNERREQYVVFGVCLIVLDLIFRKRRGGLWVEPRGGAHIFYLPLWMWAVVPLSIAISF